MHNRFSIQRSRLAGLAVAALSMLASAAGIANAATGANAGPPKVPALSPKFTQAAAFDVSPPLHVLAVKRQGLQVPEEEEREIRPEPMVPAVDHGYSGDAALQGPSRLPAIAAIPSPQTTFEGLSNQDNFDIFGGRVNPPDPIGAVGPNHYVEMVNLTFAVYDKAGSRLAGPTDTGSLWVNFPIPDCTDPSGDPVVLYDKLQDRWILSQFTTRGMNANGTFNGKPFYNCVAVSVTGDPTGAYYRYAFITRFNDVDYFPDYPKYGNWKKSYVLTSRDFGEDGGYGISVYALEKNKMIAGNPNARMVHFFVDSDVVPLNLIGDGLLPADFDGPTSTQPADDAAIPVVGTQDDDSNYGATFDALNIWELRIKWQNTPIASLVLATQLSVASFDSIFPCGVVPSTTPGVNPTGRDCLPEPGLTDGSRFLDVLSYRQRPTWRLAYRNFMTYESMVTNQAVEAAPGVAGERWYEIRRNSAGQYTVFQQGTYAPGDGVHRWMGSIAQDKNGNMLLGYSVVNGTDVFPGIRYTGRMSGDPLGQMNLGEGILINGSGVQNTTNSRWGDYTSMNVDPSDDCTFWYVNEYYQVSGVIGVNTVPWQTRIGSVKLPGCGGASLTSALSK